ncbi:MAG TPA: SCO family protein [Candidatus Cybelea sp.]|nr:SCO family protein [Candidatus Cybelea sp.]
MKSPKLAIALAVVALAAAAACTNGGGLGSIGSGGGGTPSPFPSGGIGVGIPTGKIGVENDPVWGTVSGYTQEQTSQIMAFPPGATITISNLSTTTPHTLNVIAVAGSPPPNWPGSPSLSFSPSGNGVLGADYASGSLNPGSSVKVKLSNPGIYLIGCAYHYIEFSMRDVIQVVAGATPGPTASPGPGGYTRPARKPRPALTQREPQLIDQTGRRFTLSSLRGEPLIVTFVSAHCTDACPLINAQFALAAQRIEHEHLPARLLTITLDPEHDSPQTMRELARRFAADPRHWLVAGGSRSDVHAMMRAFGVISIEGKHDSDDRHTTFVYALDPNGDLAQTLLASTATQDDILDGLHTGRWRTHA